MDISGSSGQHHSVFGGRDTGNISSTSKNAVPASAA